jgi:predicted AAA+ superfamily ATPase
MENFKETFKELILENYLNAIETYVHRSANAQILPQKALSIIGVRRSGKTTFLKQILEKHQSKNTLHIYINFSDDRLEGVSIHHLTYLIEAASELYADADFESQQKFYYLDEIQIVDKWEKFVDRLIRTAKTQVILSGSSSKMLSKDIATTMRGRSLSIEISPFSFIEYLVSLKTITHANELKKLTASKKAKIRILFKKYLIEGGFPETVNKPQVIANQILQEYLSTIFYKDVIERHQVENSERLHRLQRNLISQIGTLYTINKITEKLKAQGFWIEKSQVSQALDWFQDAYLFFSISIYTESVHKQNVNPKKLYCIDNGLIMASAKKWTQDTGTLLENLTFLSLRKISNSIFYYKTKSGFEVDFILPEWGSKPLLIQTCVTLTKAETRQREFRSLFEAMEELNIDTSYIFTIDEEDEETTNSHTIKIAPLWKLDHYFFSH